MDSTKGAEDDVERSYRRFMEASRRIGCGLEALHFVSALLDYTLNRLNPGNLKKHVSGVELEASLKPFALQEFGLAAHTVLGELGIRDARCLGEIVFALIDAEIFQKTADDRIEDFVGLGAYGRADFEQEYQQYLHGIAFRWVA